MMSDTWFIELVIIFFSGIIHGMLGFGFPMISTAFLAMFMDLKKAVLYTLLPTIALNFFSLKRDNSFSSIWKEYWLLIVSVMVGSVVGTTLLVFYYSDKYKLILAALILLYLNKDRLKISLSSRVQNHPKGMMVLFGFLSGVAGGMANIMIPVLLILILVLNIEKKRAIGVMNFCFICNKSLQVLIFGYNGNFNFQTLPYISLFVLIAIIGFFIGSRVQDKIDEKLYKKLLNTLLWPLSFYLIVSTFYK